MVCRILFWYTHQYLSRGCQVVQLKPDQLDTDVVDHRALPVNTHGKQCCYPFMIGRPPRKALETLLPCSHQPKRHRHGRPPNYYLRWCPRPNLYFCILRVGHCLLSNSCYPHIKEDAQRLSPGESTKAWGAIVEDNNTPILPNYSGQFPEDITTFGNGHLAT